MAQAEGGLALVDAGPEHFELERGPELAQGRRREPAHAQAALADAGERAVVFAKLAVERRQPVDAHRVEPVGIDGLEIEAHVEHGEPIDLDGGRLRHRTRRIPSTSANANASRHAIGLRRGCRSVRVMKLLLLYEPAHLRLACSGAMGIEQHGRCQSNFKG